MEKTLNLPTYRELSRLSANKDDVQLLEALIHHIQAEYALQRFPLFVLGAGISAGEVPLLFEMALHLKDSLNSHKKSIHEPQLRKLLEYLEDLGTRIGARKAMRLEAAEFFSVLQGSTPKHTKQAVTNIWQEFSVDLLSGGKIKRRLDTTAASNIDEYYPAIQGAKPTTCHRFVARQLQNKKGWCLSLNFDRLTAEALREDDSEQRGCVVLHTKDQIHHYFSSAEPGDLPPAVFKVRGDVFYATCSRDGCPLALRAIPLHSLLQNKWMLSGLQGDATRLSPAQVGIQQVLIPPPSEGKSRPLKCWECNIGNLILQLSFPGLRSKEEEAFPLLEAVASYIHHRISAIIVVGLSGQYDDYLLRYLFHMASHWSAPVVDVKPRDDAANPIREFADTYRESVIYCDVGMRANEFAEKWQEFEAKRPHKPRQATYKNGEPLPVTTMLAALDYPADGVWVQGENEGVSAGGVVISRDKVGEVLSGLLPLEVKRKLELLAQLSIDNLVLSGPPGTHNRWFHSIGATAVGLLWHDVLTQGIGSAKSSNGERIALAAALMLHDYGHLPFSHLIEQVLKSINWTYPIHGGHSAELNLLTYRLSPDKLWKEGQKSEAQAIDKFWRELAKRSGFSQGSDVVFLLRLIEGIHAKPWLSAIVNSPIDADKIDYIVRDIREVTKLGASLQIRLPTHSPSSWLSEFLVSQYINGHGLLCLNGRSALAMKQLLEERLFLYKHFYRSPEIRLAERIAMELVQQYVIYKVWDEIRKNPGFLHKFEGDHDLRRAKSLLVQIILEREYVVQTDKREWEFLTRMRDEIGKFPVDQEYREFLNHIFGLLESMAKPENRGIANLRSLLEKGMLLAGPFYADREYFDAIREVLRPLQHQHCCDVLFDLVELPPLLSIPRPFGISLWEHISPLETTNILVPDSPAERWTFQSIATKPLTNEAFKGIESNICMVYIFDPYMGDRLNSHYAVDKFRTSCRRAGIPIFEREEGVTR